MSKLPSACLFRLVAILALYAAFDTKAHGQPNVDAWTIPEGSMQASRAVKVLGESSGVGVLMWTSAGAVPDFKVRLPNGVILDRTAIAAAGGNFVDSLDFAVSPLPDNGLEWGFSLFNPPVGRSVSLFLPGPLPPGEYALVADYPAPSPAKQVVIVATDFRDEVEFSVRLGQVIARPGQAVPVFVGAANAQSPWPGATITAHWRRGEEDGGSFPLFDDGQSGDGDAGNGLYAATFTPTAAGVHDFIFVVSGEVGGVSFTRKRFERLYVCDAGATIQQAGILARKVVDASNHLVAVELDVPLSVTAAGEFRVEAKLTSPVSGAVRQARAAASLGTGPGVITLSVPAKDLVDLGGWHGLAGGTV